MPKKSAAVASAITLGGIEYVIVPKVDYLRLQDSRREPEGRDAGEFVRELLSSNLRKAREHADLTQAQLAERLGKSQTMISQAESGATKVSERYVRSVLKACGLPEDWNGKDAPKKRARKAG